MDHWSLTTVTKETTSETVIPNRYFGVEMEFKFPRRDFDTMARMLRANSGVAVDAHRRDANTNWVLVFDGSVGRAGGELVSPKLQGEDGVADVAKIARAATAAEGRVDASCGLHVHVDATDLSLDDMKKIVLAFIKYEKMFDAFMPNSRRASNNYYTTSMRDLREWELNAAAAERKMFESVNACADIPALIEFVSRHSRYRKLNLQAWHRHKTIEFRHHQGSLDAAKITNWVRLVVALVENAPKSKIRPRRKNIQLPAGTELMRFARSFNIPKSVTKFYIRRAKWLAGNESIWKRPTASA